MPLPNPSAAIPQNAPAMNARENYDLAEAVQTGLKAGFLSAQQGFFSRVPKVLGGGILAERAEFKRRELYEKQGRDVTTGRKLTQEELQERDARRRSYGVMGDLRDSVDEILDILTTQFGPSAKRIKEIAKTSITKSMIVPTESTTPYELAPESGTTPASNSLAVEEKMDEQKRENEKLQENLQEKDHSFFETLFAKYFASEGIGGKEKTTEQQKGGGWLSTLADSLSILDDVADLRRGRGGMRSPKPPPLPGASVTRKPPSLPGASAASKPGGSWLSRAWGGMKNIGSSAFKAVRGAASGVASGVTKYGGQALTGLKNLGGVALKTAITPLAKVAFAALGPLLTGIFASWNISNIKKDPTLSPQEKKKQIGIELGRMIGSLLGGGVAAILSGGAGVAVTGLLDALGIGPGALGAWLTEKLGGEMVYDLFSGIPGIGSLIKVDEKMENIGAEGTAPNTGNTTSSESSNQTMKTSDVYGSQAGIGQQQNLQMNAAAVPATMPSSAATMSTLQTENSMLKSIPTPVTVAAPTTNTVVTNNNSTSWMSSLTTTRTGADLDERAFRMGLAF
jgi:hypothetical protein